MAGFQVGVAAGAALVAGALLTGAPAAHAACPAPAAGYVTVIRTALSGPTTYTVPAGITSVHLCVIGGSGGATTNGPTGSPFPTPGGAGEEAQADARVLPGQLLLLAAGRNGADGTPTGPVGPVPGQAAGGGGSESSFGEVTGTGGQGGGLSSVAVGGILGLAPTFLVVAGGGGGAGQPSSDYLAHNGTDTPFIFPGGAGGDAGGKGANGPTSGLHGEPGGDGGLPGGATVPGAAGLGAKDPLAPKTCGNDGLAGTAGKALTVPSPGGAGGAAGYPGLGTSGSGISLQCVPHTTVKGAVVASFGGGGGGGSGWTGGGGGGGGAGSSYTTLDPVVGAGGGGGGGSTHVDPLLISNDVYRADTTHAPMAQVRFPVALAALSPAGGLSFAPPPAGTASAPQSVVIANRGAAPLTVGPPGLGGTDPQDFRVASDTCSAGPVAPGGSCAIGVVFAPQTAGARTARLLAATNDPGTPSLSVPLRGGAAAGGGAATAGGRAVPRLALGAGAVVFPPGGGPGRLAAVCRLAGGGACRVTGVLTRVRAHRAAVVLAHVSGRLRAGRRGLLAVRLTAAGRRLLAGGALRAALSGVVRAAGARGRISGVVGLRIGRRR